MDFLIKALLAWFKHYELKVAIYDSNGNCCGYWNTEPKMNYWPKRLDEAHKSDKGWYTYPLNTKSKYRGCICFEYNEDEWDDEDCFEKPDFYTVLAICRFAEIACEM